MSSATETTEAVQSLELERRYWFPSVPHWVPNCGEGIWQGYVSISNCARDLSIIEGSLVSSQRDGLSSWKATPPVWVLKWLEGPGVLRVRRRGEKCFLTVKKPSEIIGVPHEWEEPIPAPLFEGLWSQTSGGRIHKERSVLSAEKDPGIVPGLFVEWDLFRGELDGLVIAEIEFPTQEGFSSFDLPALWRTAGGIDITGDIRFSNLSLSTLDRVGLEVLMREFRSA